ncbi:MAG: putative lipid II flippase FtsW [Patescibacteria group bacterium]
MATLRRKTPDLVLLLAVLTLLGLGLVMVASASTITGLAKAKDAFYYIKHQLIFAGLGLLGMFIMMNFDYHHLRRFTRVLAILAPVMLVLVLIFGQKIGGARRWIDLGFFNVQSSEFAKLALVLILAHFLAELGEGVRRFGLGVFLPLCYAALIAGLVMLEPDFGTVLVVSGTFFCMVFAAGASLWHLGVLAGAALAGLIALAVSAPYRLKRLIAFKNPFHDPQGTGYQIIQSLYALGSGGPFGVGIGRSRQKFSYLPEPHTDYIFSILGEEMGLVGTMLVLCLFALIIWRGLRTALAAVDLYGTLLAVGITSLLGVQVILNIGVVTSTLPVTGITLPLLSYGGSSLMVTLVGLGILLNISGQAK